MEDIPDADMVIVPVGGGGLISGIAMAAKAINPKVTVIGVQSENYDSARASVEAGSIVEHVSGETIADGIAIRRPGDITLSMMQKYVDSILTVSDETIALALYHLLEHNKILVEPAGATGLAAILAKKIDISGKKAVAVLSGGNINLLLLSKIIYKSLEHESRLIRIGFKIPDRPGTLYRIASAISEAGGNIYHAEVDNLDESTPIGFQSITFTVNVRNSKHAAELLESPVLFDCQFECMIPCFCIVGSEEIDLRPVSFDRTDFCWRCVFRHHNLAVDSTDPGCECDALCMISRADSYNACLLLFSCEF